MRLGAWVLASLALATPALAFARGPEQIDQLEPGAGEWQTEYFGTFGNGDGREHALEAMLGLTETLAIGVEFETEYSDGEFAFDTLGLKALYRLTGDDAPVALGLQVQLGFDDHAALAQAELRLIAEAESEKWWAQGNFMLRRTSEDGRSAVGAAYAVSLQHYVTEHAWLGFEGSGQIAPPGSGGADEAGGHYLGPSLTLEWQAAPGTEIEAGLAFFRRIGGVGPPNHGRLFIQTSF